MLNWKDKIGEIPSDWQAVNAKEYLLLESGQRPAEHVTDDPNDIPSLGGENITLDGFIDLSNLRFISYDYFKKMKKGIVLTDDILINKDGANTGKIALVRNLPYDDAAVNEHLFIIRTNGSFDQKYLFYFLFSDKGNRQIRAKITGSAQGGINTGVFKGIFIPKPPKPEQQKIAAILTKVDDAIQAVKNTIEKVERLKKALMQNLLTGKLKPDGTWRRDDEFYEDEKFGKVPVGWDSSRIKNYGELQTGKTPPTADENNFGNDYMFITPGDIGENRLIKKTERYVSEKGIKYSYKIPPRSVCVVCIGSTIGKIGITTEECCTNQQIHTVICNNDNDPNFLFYFMQFRKAHFKEYAGINATPQINKSSFSKYPVLQPTDIQEQKAISEKLLTIEKQIDQKYTKIQKLERLKKALMQNLLTGKVRVKV